MIVRRYEAQQLLSQAQGSGGGLVPDEFQRTEAGYTCLAQYMARAITVGIFGPAGWAARSRRRRGAADSAAAVTRRGALRPAMT